MILEWDSLNVSRITTAGVWYAIVKDVEVMGYPSTSAKYPLPISTFNQIRKVTPLRT